MTISVVCELFDCQSGYYKSPLFITWMCVCVLLLLLLCRVCGVNIVVISGLYNNMPISCCSPDCDLT